MEFRGFKFGENWESYSKIIDENRLNQARASMIKFIGEENIRGKTFLDIGCGSGLFSIAACLIGASCVVGIDLDPVSVETSIKNANKLITGKPISFYQISVLDHKAMNTLGEFDLVYSWGVLHHTGDMKNAIVNAADRMKSDGRFMIAIYNRHFTSKIWKVIKYTYNKLPTTLQKSLILVMYPIIYLSKLIVTRRNPLKMKRGMDFMHNIVDWVGGYPYEYASTEEMIEFLSSIGLNVERISNAMVPTGCNEYLCSKSNFTHD